MATAQEIYEAMLRGPVAEALHGLGFTGTFRRFSLCSGDYQGVIDFKKSRHSNSDEIPSYQAFLSIHRTPNGPKLWGDVVLRGILPQPRNRPLYTITSNQSPEEAASALVSDLQQYAYPALMVGLAEPDFDRDEYLWNGGNHRATAISMYFSGLAINPFGWDLQSAGGLLELTHHEQPDVRRLAVDWLVYRFRDDARVTPVVVDLAMNDPHSTVRAMAVSLLVYRQGNSEVSTALVTALDDPCYQVRWWARYGRQVEV